MGDFRQQRQHTDGPDFQQQAFDVRLQLPVRRRVTDRDVSAFFQ